MTTDEKREWLAQHIHAKPSIGPDMSIEKYRDYFRQRPPDDIDFLFLYYLKQSMKE